jgi:hypothetical protein
MRKRVMDVRRAVQLGMLVAFAVMSPMALAQEQGEQQQTPTPDHGQHHGQTGQQTGQQMVGPSMMQGGMGPGMMQGGMGPSMSQCSSHA